MSSSSSAGQEAFGRVEKESIRPKIAYKYRSWEEKFVKYMSKEHPDVVDVDGVPQCGRITIKMLKGWFGSISV
jgi:hypothetical protein